MVKRILRYVYAASVLFLILSVASIWKNWSTLSVYFSNSLFSVGSVLLYLLIFGAALFLIFRVLFFR